MHARPRKEGATYGEVAGQGGEAEEVARVVMEVVSGEEMVIVEVVDGGRWRR